MVTFKQDILENLIKNHQQQAHKSKWTNEEDILLLECIACNWSQKEINTRAIKHRTKASIFTRANYLGFGYKTNKDDGQIYFLEDINHKNRRTKEEILAELGKVPIHPAKPVEDCVEESTVIIPEINQSDEIKSLVQTLDKVKEFLLNQGTSNERT